MGKKLLTGILINLLIMFNPWNGFGQCPSSVGISADPGTTICQGTEVIFTANPSGGDALEFQWQINDSNITGATNQTFSTTDLTNGQKVRVVVTSTTEGHTECSTSSSEITMTVNAVQTPTVSISTSKTSICPGEDIIFNTSNTYGGSSPTYQWYINSNNTVAKTGASATFSSTDFVEGNNTVRVVLTSNFNCADPTTAEATSSTFELKPDATISTPANKDQTVCINTPIENIAFALGGGATNATVTGLPSGITGALSGGNFVLSGTPTVKGSFTYTVSTSGTCIQKTATGTITVNPDATIALTSGNNSQTVCAAGGVADGSIDPIKYSIDGTGASVTGLPTGIEGSYNSGIFTIQGSSSVTGTHDYSIKATGDCGDSAPLSGTITITENITPTVSITSSDDDNIICAGTSITFTATPTNGGSNPSYQWKVGTTNVGNNSSTFTTSDLTDGQSVTVVMSSSETCLTTAAATSNAITTTVNPNLTPEVTITSSDSDICPGDSVTFTATPVNGGSAPSYQWKVGSTNVGTNSPTFTTTSLTDGQSVSVVITSSEPCLATATATSNSISTTVLAPPPATPEAITGPQEVCATATGLVYSVAAVTDAESYVWNVPTGWNITGGSGTNSITVSASSTGGSISVAAVNTCGTSSETSLAVTPVEGAPATPGTITSNLPSTAVCPPLNNVVFSVDEVTNSSGYNWILPNGWDIVSGENTNAVTVDITSNAQYNASESVSVEATNICGNSSASTLSGIAIDSFVVTDLGDDKTFCRSNSTFTLDGYVAFGSNLSKLKIESITTSGTNPAPALPNGKVNDFSYSYTPSTTDLDNGSVTFTVITETPGGACDAGKDEITIFFKPLPTATITATSPVCSGDTSTLTFTGTPNSRVTYELPGGTNQTIDIGSSGTATVTTAALTANSTYSLVSSINLDTPACSNTLTESVTVTITPKPTAEITYSEAPFCTSLTSGQTPVLSGTGDYTNGTYSSTTGLTIDASTGAITPSTSTPGIYTVTYKTPASGGCEEVVATTEVTITEEPTATISYSGTPFCTTDSQAKTVNLTGTDAFSGGVFSAPEGLTIDSGTGAITPSSSTAGTYTVTYETPSAGGCSPVPATTEVTITEVPTASISYAGAPFCHSDTSAQAVTLTGTNAFSGGVFTAPSGVIIDASSGAITPSSSTPGTYEITYTTPSSAGCGEVTATTSITITETPAAEMNYNGPYCTSDATAHLPEFTNTVGAYQGGIFRSTPDGLSLDASTGAINAKNSSPNTYTVFYELPAGEGCGTSEIQTSVTITQVPQLEITYTTPLCTSDTASYPVTFSSNAVGAYQGGTFTATSGLAIDTEGNIIAANSTPGIHTITYTTPEANGCGPVEVTTDIEIFEQVVITSPPVNAGICSTEPASFEVVASGDNLSYQWMRIDGAAITNATGVNTSTLSFSNATATNAGEYFVEITGASSCTSVSSEPVTLNVDENIVIIKPTEDITFCDQEREGVTFEFIAHANGAPLEFTWIKDGADIPNADTDQYSFTTTGPSGDDGQYTGTMTISGPNPADNGVYAVRISGPDYFTCSEAISKTFTLNVTPLPEPPTTEPVILCQGETADPLSASGATGATFKWYTSAMEPIDGVPTPSTVDAGNTSYFVTQTTEVCESNPTELVVTVNQTPALPTTQETLIYCFEEEGAPLTATGTDTNSVLNWYGPDDSSLALSAAPTPLTTSAGNTKYWVSQSIGDCESALVEIVVTVKPLPELAVTADSQNICEGNSTILHASGAETYVWSLAGNEIGTTADLSVTPEAPGSYTYKVTGTDTFGCVNTSEIVIDVETPSDGGVLTGPSSVCTGANTGTLTLSEYLGEIQRWESSTDGTNWTAISETSAEYTFQNLTAPTQFRAVVKNGVCNEAFSTIWEITIDPLPVGGELNFDSFGRVIETCSNPGPDYNISLILSGQVGDVVRWRYKEGTATQWSTVTEAGEIFTGTTLSPDLIRSLGINQSTIFEVEMGSGACTPNVFSQNATMSIISSDIAPTSVTATPGVLCTGELVTLSAKTGYGTGEGFEEGGAFDFSSITNHGWRIKDENGTESNFDSSADNGVAAIWLRTNPLPLTTAYLSPPYNTYSQYWDSSAGNEGNKGFAIVSGPNPSTLETSIFNLFAVENPVLTFDQGYVLTPGSAIYVEISTDGGNNYENVPLYFVEVDEAATEGEGSGNYDSFGDDSPGDRSNNKIELDLTKYAGLGNLRIRFRYEGVNDGNVWAVDAISLPVEATNVDMVWTDYTDPENPVVIGKNSSEQWAPTLIGWNDFEIRTKLVYDSTGEQCPVVENFSTVKVFVFDKYTSTATAVAGSCGNNNVSLGGVVVNSNATEVTEFPTRDNYTAGWEVVTGPDGYNFSETHFTKPGSTTTAVNDPDAIFSPGISGSFTLRWALNRTADDDLINETCPPTYNDVTFEIKDCTALDFDGIDDFVDLGEGYTGDYSIEAWIRPEASTGTIISTPQLEINMEDLPNGITPNSRWYHIAVDSNGQLYVDGIAIGTISKTGTERSFIGARWNAPNTENHFSGWIEEVRIWNGNITQDQIRFLMNQRLQNAANMGVEIPMPAPGLAYASLVGYYQLFADNILNGGYTPDLATSAVNGKLRNMETFQENTAPLPYTSRIGGQDWATDDTWTHFPVWDAPNSNGLDGTPIEWNIVRTNHNINSGDKNITVLGLKSETADKLLKIAAPGDENEYNSGRFLRVTHYLLLDGNIDLVGESQLLQDSGSILDAASKGWLKRDQQGVANSYNYNYWSSPVSVGTGNVPYTIAGVMRDGTDSRNPLQLDFGAPYAYADGGPTTPRKISNYWLHKFRGTANVYGEWVHIGSTGQLKVGEGFTMKGTSGPVPLDQVQNYTFQGTPNNGDFNLTIGENQNYLIGNPYASAMDANEFIKNNLKDITGGTNSANVFNGALYFWDHFGQINTHILKEYVGGYATYSLASDEGVPAASIDERINANNAQGYKTPKRYIPVGQSFFINTVLDEDLQETFTVTGGDVTFKNSQRFFVTEANGSSTFLRPEEREKGKQQENLDQVKKDTRYKIRLNFRSPSGYHRQILVTADANTSTGFDLGYDAVLIDNNKEDIFWLLNGHKLVIQAVPDFNTDRILPLGMVISKPGNISVEIEALENMPEDTRVYIRDNTDSTYYNIREKKFNASIQPGYYGDKYDIVFDNGGGKVNKEKPVPGPIGIKYSMDENELSISNPELHEIEKVSIYNLLGQEIEIFENVVTAKEVKLPVKRNYSSAVYIVKVFTSKDTFNKKVIIK